MGRYCRWSLSYIPHFLWDYMEDLISPEFYYKGWGLFERLVTPSESFVRGSVCKLAFLGLGSAFGFDFTAARLVYHFHVRF